MAIVTVPKSTGKQAIMIAAIALVAMLATAWALGAIVGPVDNGLRYERSPAGSACRLSRTTLLGAAGNSSFSIPESSIRGAAVQCAAGGVGGRRDSTCEVYVTLASGDRQLVSSYALRSQAEHAAGRINDYLRDGAARELVIEQDLLAPVLLYALLPVVIVLIAVAGGRWWRSPSATVVQQVNG